LKNPKKRASRGAQVRPFGIHVVQEVVPAGATHHVLGRKTSDFFRPPIPEENFPGSVRDINPFSKGVEKKVEKFRVFQNKSVHVFSKSFL
jgi:hypothetical protein